MSPLIPKRLQFEDSGGAGLQIFADIPERVSFVEVAMKPGFKPVLHGHKMLVGYEPWTGPFTPIEWSMMIEKLLKEMVEAWNEKHAQP